MKCKAWSLIENSDFILHWADLNFAQIKTKR